MTRQQLNATMHGFAPIRDIPKTLVYRLARWRNEQEGGAVIPESVITKPPSAELAPDQLAAVTHPGGGARIIAPAGPGGGWDQTARSLSEVMAAMGAKGGTVKAVEASGAGAVVHCTGRASAKMSADALSGVCQMA